MTDEPTPSPVPSDHDRYNARLGIFSFLLYLAFYAGFVLINAFRAEWMDMVVLAGLNLAVVYGFALIIVAIVLSMIYGLWCRVDSPGRDGDAS